MSCHGLNELDFKYDTFGIDYAKKKMKVLTRFTAFKKGISVWFRTYFVKL